MVQPCHSLVPQQLFADPCSMLENTEQDSKSCCASSATRPRFDIDTNRRIASAPLRFNLLTRLMNKPPGLEHVTDQPEKPVIVDLLCQDPQEDLMVGAAEAVRDITLDEPHGTGPSFLHFPQCGVAASPFPETV